MGGGRLGTCEILLPACMAPASGRVLATSGKKCLGLGAVLTAGGFSVLCVIISSREFQLRLSGMFKV